MGSYSFPRIVAGLISEDADEVKDGPPEQDPKETSSKAKKPTNWGYEFIYEFDELEDAEILGPEVMYGGQFTVGADYAEGEEAVMHMPNGDPGYPGSAGEWEWEITDVSDVVDHANPPGLMNFDGDSSGLDMSDANDVDLTDELKGKLIDALHKYYEKNHKLMEELLDDDANQGDNPGEDRADDDYDRWKDEGRHEDY